ncbi:G protein-coupled receptor [Aphelenchoides besseyi]|nr:G protein-coupled receptor [Aphelenchoides besseyi]
MEFISDLTTNIPDDQDNSNRSSKCADVPELSHTRRYLDLVCSSIGLCLSAIHLALLLYIRFRQKHKGFFLLLIQVVVQLKTSNRPVLVGSLQSSDHVFSHYRLVEYALDVFFRAYIWLYLVNSLIATYGFMIVALCLDRYVALNNPLYYRLCFSRLKIRLIIVFTCLSLGIFVCLRWIIYNHMVDEDDFSMNVYIQSTAWYLTIKIICTLLQYFVSGVVMILISISIIYKLKELDRHHFNELRMAEVSRNMWTKNHKTTATICLYLTLSFIAFNWPYALADFFYSDERSQETYFEIIEVVINLCQLLYMQLNIFFFAYCSRIYRHNLYLLLTFAVRRLKLAFCWRNGSVHFHSNCKKHVKGDDSCLRLLIQSLQLMSKFIFLLPVLCITGTEGLGRSQSAAAIGTLLCNGEKVDGVRLQLYDVPHTIGKDDLIGFNKTTNGTFLISGYKSAVFKINPKLSIIHDCNNTLACQRKLEIPLPKEAITRGKVANLLHDIGTIDLAVEYPNEKRDCNL